jgi:hypothetical protein
LPGGKEAGAYGKVFKPCHLHVPTGKFWKPQPPGALGAYLGLYTDSFSSVFLLIIHYNMAWLTWPTSGNTKLYKILERLIATLRCL